MLYNRTFTFGFEMAPDLKIRMDDLGTQLPYMLKRCDLRRTPIFGSS